MAQHLHAVALVVPDYDAAIDFYVGKIGFTLISDIRLNASKRWVLVAPPGSRETRLLLAQADNDQQQMAIGQQTGGRVGFFLETDDFDRDHATMIAAGVVFEEQPRVEEYGKVAVWNDPFGNRWDLLEFTRGD